MVYAYQYISQTLEQLNEQNKQFEQTIRTLTDWIDEQTIEIDSMRTRQFEAGVKDNIRKCHVSLIFNCLLMACDRCRSGHRISTNIETTYSNIVENLFASCIVVNNGHTRSRRCDRTSSASTRAFVAIDRTIENKIEIDSCRLARLQSYFARARSTCS
jgi:hypothetical protein